MGPDTASVYILHSTFSISLYVYCSFIVDQQQYLRMLLSSFSLILGVTCYVFGFPLVFMDQAYIAWQRRIVKDIHAMRIVGAVFAVLSALALRRQWQITADGEGFMVAVAWVVFLKSIFIAWWPSTFTVLRDRFEERLVDIPALQMFVGFVVVLFGALFTYFGILLPQ